MNRNLFKNKKTLGIIVILVSVVLIVFGYLNMNKISSGILTLTDSQNKTYTYSNKDFGFEIQVPDGWKIYENLDPNSPQITLYKVEFKANPPFDIYSNANRISFFPHGVPTEGVTGDARPSSNNYDLEADSAIDYVLTDQTVWATMLNPKNEFKNWEDWGFVWIASKIENEKNGCARGEAQVSFEECNPYDGDIFTRTGKINQKTRQQMLEILKTFTPIK
jgi:hypothetical protein